MAVMSRNPPALARSGRDLRQFELSGLMRDQPLQHAARRIEPIGTDGEGGEQDQEGVKQPAHDARLV
jgi:hypothetical protein